MFIRRIHNYSLLVLIFAVILISCTPIEQKKSSKYKPTNIPAISKNQTPTQISGRKPTQELTLNPTSKATIIVPTETLTSTKEAKSNVTQTPQGNGKNYLISGTDKWRLTSTEISRQIDVLGYTISPVWQDFPNNYKFLLLRFDCVTGKSLIELYTGEDMGLTFIHDSDGYSDIYVTDNFGERHFATMIGDCWISFLIQPENHGFMLFFLNLDPVDLSTSKPLRWDLDQITFVSERQGNPDIFTMNPDGSQQTPIINHPGIDIEPAISPDGENIVFTSDREGTRDIFLFDLLERSITNLTRHPSEDGAPVWGTDGKNLAFQSIRDGNWEIFQMGVSERNFTNVTQHPASDQFPTWSFTGDVIAFQTNRDGNWEIYTVNTDGSNLQRITNHPAEDLRPAWSPTDPVLAFWSNRDGFWRLYLFDIVSLLLTPITDYANPGKFISPPSWSSDGTKILFSIIRDGNQEIYLINKDGSDPRRLTNQTSHDYDPDW